jgi:excinuclease UvrABC helicase subunit UvrB
MSDQPDPRYSDCEGKSFDSLARTDRVRDVLHETCLMCNGVGHWSSIYADAKYAPPPGHRFEYIEGPTLIVMDTCHASRVS